MPRRLGSRLLTLADDERRGCRIARAAEQNRDGVYARAATRRVELEVLIAPNTDTVGLGSAHQSVVIARRSVQNVLKGLPQPDEGACLLTAQPARVIETAPAGT